jgi:hypothetical protein
VAGRPGFAAAFGATVAVVGVGVGTGVGAADGDAVGHGVGVGHGHGEGPDHANAVDAITTVAAIGMTAATTIRRQCDMKRIFNLLPP